jgi:hypothetical protein
MSARRGLFLAPFDELVGPATLVDVARRAAGTASSSGTTSPTPGSRSKRSPTPESRSGWRPAGRPAAARSNVRPAGTGSSRSDCPTPTRWPRIAAEIAELRDDEQAGFDLVVEIAHGDDAAPWEAAGATWVLTAFDSRPRLGEVEAAIDRGPRN